MRGRLASVDATRVAPNGYHYTRTKDGWVLTHRLVAEKKLGRKLRPTERVSFKDNDRTNFADPNNLVIREVQTGSKAKQIARIRAKIEDLQAQLADLESDAE